MRLVRLTELISFAVIALLLSASGAGADSLPRDEAAKLLPNQIGSFRSLSQLLAPAPYLEKTAREDFGAVSAAARYYRSKDGEQLRVSVIRTRSDSSAYALLTNFWRIGIELNDKVPGVYLGDVGTSSRVEAGTVQFFKGSTFVEVGWQGNSLNAGHPQAAAALARALADTIDNGDGDIPVLVKHLPNWQSVQQPLYAVSLPTLKSAVTILGNTLTKQPALDALTFEGGAEAVAANYGPSQLVIVEFNTPQLASDNDRRITAKIQELRNQGQPVPTAYRRVGNYSVLVFSAPDVQTANQLVEQIKYEQLVQWLGDNPHWLEEAQRKYTETTLGVFVAVVKASGLAFLACFAVGGFFGALLFSRRRARQASDEAYSDAGGMMRLNLDDMTAQTDASKLIGPGS